MNKHIFLTNDNAEEVLEDALRAIRLREWDGSRRAAFEDCTNYWKERIEKVLESNSMMSEKLIEISNMFDVEVKKK